MSVKEMCSLVLECNCPECQGGYEHGPLLARFDGETSAACYCLAVKNGWRFTRAANGKLLTFHIDCLLSED